MKDSTPSRTARAVAAERALLHDLGALDDPFAATMLDTGMRVALGVARRVPRRAWARSVTLAGLAGRVLWFDGQVTDAIDSGISRVVTVGAGYDSRPWRLPADGVTYVEVDHPATQADKRRRAPSTVPVFVGVDLLRDDVAVALADAGLDPVVPTLFVVEGVTMYLDGDLVRSLLGRLASTAAPGSRLAVDFLPSGRPDTGVHRRQLALQQLARAGSGEGFRFGADGDEAVALVTGAGWEPTRVVSGRDAATALVPAGCGLPTSRVTTTRTHVAARLAVSG